MIDGVKTYAGNLITVGDMQILNPTRESLLQAGYTEEDETEVLDLTQAIERKLFEIDVYDRSEAVNSFILNGMPIWLDKETRISVMNSTKIRKSLGHKETTVWIEGHKLTVDCDLTIQLLSHLEVYALTCFDVTESHKANVRQLQTIEEVENYNYKAGYPEKLNLKTV